MTWEYSLVSMINKNYLTYSPGWRKLGKKFYYPKCCVYNFSRYITADKVLQHKTKGKLYINSIFDGTGYVPCFHCLVKIKTKENKIYKYIHNKRKSNRFSKKFSLRITTNEIAYLEKFWNKYKHKEYA